MSHLFLLFLITSVANIITPGLGVVFIVLMAADKGWKKTIPGCLGIALGITVLFTIALSGIGVIIATSTNLFAAIKVAGGLYIFYLAWHMWHKPVVRLEAAGSGSVTSPEGDTPMKLFGRCALISLTNPQPIVFGVTVLPQFIDPSIAYVPQAALMIAVYTALVFVLMILYALLASRARVFLSKGSGPLWMKRVSAGIFVLLGALVLWSAASNLLA